jgi:hypothetical protein
LWSNTPSITISAAPVSVSQHALEEAGRSELTSLGALGGFIVLISLILGIAKQAHLLLVVIR